MDWHTVSTNGFSQSESRPRRVPSERLQATDLLTRDLQCARTTGGFTVVYGVLRTPYHSVTARRARQVWARHCTDPWPFYVNRTLLPGRLGATGASGQAKPGCQGARVPLAPGSFARNGPKLGPRTHLSLTREPTTAWKQPSEDCPRSRYGWAICLPRWGLPPVYLQYRHTLTSPSTLSSALISVTARPLPAERGLCNGRLINMCGRLCVDWFSFQRRTSSAHHLLLHFFKVRKPHRHDKPRRRSTAEGPLTVSATLPASSMRDPRGRLDECSR